MNWDEEYEGNRRLWGEAPSEIAAVAENYLRTIGKVDRSLRILDAGCGYGRDAAYLSGRLRCSILGVDPSSIAIEMAMQSCGDMPNVAFRCCEVAALQGSRFDVVLSSNVYQLLTGKERLHFAQAVVELLEPSGWLFLSTMSTSDPQHYGRGLAMPGEPHSFVDKHYLHFCTEQELRRDFAGLRIVQLYEHEYFEPRPDNSPHHHVSWMLVGRRAGVA